MAYFESDRLEYQRVKLLLQDCESLPSQVNRFQGTKNNNVWEHLLKRLYQCLEKIDQLLETTVIKNSDMDKLLKGRVVLDSSIATAANNLQ